MKLFGREPTLWISVISAIIIFAGTFGFHYLSGDQAGLVVAFINAVAAAITAYFVRPIAPAVFLGAVSAGVALAASYGFNLTIDQVGALNLMVVPILALLTRGQVSPEETKLTQA